MIPWVKLDTTPLPDGGDAPQLLVSWTEHAVSSVTVHDLADGAPRGTVELPGPVYTVVGADPPKIRASPSPPSIVTGTPAAVAGPTASRYWAGTSAP